MWLNQQTIDAIRMMTALSTKWPIFLKASDLSALTGVSVMNVQKTAHALGVSGLVETARGRYGGLRIARAAEAISIGDIVRAFEPKDCPVNFLSADAADSVSQLLFKAHRGFFAPLENTTLLDLSISQPRMARA